MLQLYYIWSKIRISIAIWINMRSYHYWLNKMRKILWMWNQHFIWENIMLSSLKDMILILQHICRPYQVNTQMNNKRQWMEKLRALWEGTHGTLFQGSQLLITMFFLKHFLSNSRGNLIGGSVNSRHNILWEGMSGRDFLLNPWTRILQWSSGPQWGWCWFFSLFLVFRV